MPNSALNPTSLRSAGYCHVRPIWRRGAEVMPSFDLDERTWGHVRPDALSVHGECPEHPHIRCLAFCSGSHLSR